MQSRRFATIEHSKIINLVKEIAAAVFFISYLPSLTTGSDANPDLLPVRCYRLRQEIMAQKFSESFYHSKEWLAVREQILKRDRYVCQHCKLPAQEVHHIIHLTPDNIWDISITLNPSNLISLCSECHKKIHRPDRAAGRRKALGLSEGDCADGFHFDENGQVVPD